MARIRVRILPSNIIREVETKTGCVSEIIRRLGFPRESIVLLYKGEPLLEDMCLEDGAMVDAYVATSGG